MEKTKQALDYLCSNEILYAPLYEPLRRGHARVEFLSPGAVAIYEEKSQTHMLAYDDEENFAFALDSIERIDDQDMFLCFDSWGAKEIERRFFSPQGASMYECFNATYLKKEKILIEGDFDIRLLGMEYEDFINSQYLLSNSKNYIHSRLRERSMFGAFIDSSLAGFIGLHDEGSIGMLEILPDYRRRGLGFALEGYMINHCLDLGQVPFCQIMTDNDASLNLQKKLGYEISERRVYWVFEQQKDLF